MFRKSTPTFARDSSVGLILMILLSLLWEGCIFAISRTLHYLNKHLLSYKPKKCGVGLSLGDYCQSHGLEQSERLVALGPALSE